MMIRTKHRKRGQVLVELVLVFVLFMVIIVGMVDAGRALLRVHQMTQVAREVARIASITPGITTTAIQNQVKTRARPVWEPLGMKEGNIQIAVDQNQGVIDVRVTQKFNDAVGVSFLPFFNGLDLNTEISMPLLVAT